MSGYSARAVLLVGAVAAWLAVACGEDHTILPGPVASPGPTDTAPPEYHGVRTAAPLERPDVTLTDAQGDPFDFRAETAGEVTLVFVGYTHCPDVCPTFLAKIDAALDMAGPAVREAVNVVFVTDDPDRDTPERLRTWLGFFDAEFIGLTGPYADLAVVFEAIDMHEPGRRPDLGTGEYEIGHSAFVTLYTQDDLGHLLYTKSISAAELAEDLAVLVSRGWEGP